MKENAIVDLHSSDVPSTAYTNYKQYLKSFCVLQYHYDDQHDNTDVSKTFFKTKIKTKTLISRPRPSLMFKNETKTKLDIHFRPKNEKESHLIILVFFSFFFFIHSVTKSSLQFAANTSSIFAFLQLVLVDGISLPYLQCIDIFVAFLKMIFQPINSLLSWCIATE